MIISSSFCKHINLKFFLIFVADSVVQSARFENLPDAETYPSQNACFVMPKWTLTLLQIDQVFSNVKRNFSSYCLYFYLPAKEINFGEHTIFWFDRNLSESDFKHEFFNFDGIPYIIVGMYYLSCQFGIDTQLDRKRQKRKVWYWNIRSSIKILYNSRMVNEPIFQ